MGTGSYDAIIVDYKMPVMSGLELLRTLVSSGYDVPMVMATGAGDERIAPEGVGRVIARHQTELENVRLQRDLSEKNLLLQQANAKLAKLSITDGLTGLYNRGYLAEALGTEFAKAKRYRT